MEKTCNNCGAPPCHKPIPTDKEVCEEWMPEVDASVNTTSLGMVIMLGLALDSNVKDVTASLYALRGKSNSWEKDIRDDSRFTVQVLYDTLLTLRYRQDKLKTAEVVVSDSDWKLLVGDDNNA